jgi:hypothetical protein
VRICDDLIPGGRLHPWAGRANSGYAVSQAVPSFDAISSASSLEELDAARVRYLGRKGELSASPAARQGSGDVVLAPC